MRINFCGIQVLVTQNLLYSLHVHAVLQHQRGRRVTQLVAGVFIAVQSGGGQVLFHQRVYHGTADALILTGQKQRVFVLAADGSAYHQIARQRILAGLVQIDHPHLIALAQHPQGIVVDVGDIQTDQLRDTQAAVEKQRQDAVIPLPVGAVHRVQQGEGLVQRQIPYSDGSALRLTTARYYTPTGRSIQKPYTIGDDESYEEDIWNRYKNNEFFSADSIHFADSLKRTTPGGKVVYGGGGIMPDVFIPADTTDVTKYFIEVSGRNILYRYTIEYADRHREALNAVQTIGDLQALLDSDKTLVDDFVRYAARKGVAPRYGDIARSRRLIEAQLRAYIGRNTKLEDNGFYANIYPVDNVIVRAVGILKEDKND